MAARLLFVIGIAAAFLILTPVSASAHCHEPSAYQLAPSSGGHEVSSANPCGESGRRGIVVGAGGFALGATAYGLVAVARARTSGSIAFPSDALWTGRGNPHDVPDLEDPDEKETRINPKRVENLQSAIKDGKANIETGVLGGDAAARSLFPKVPAGSTIAGTVKSEAPFQPAFAPPSVELVAAVVASAALRGLVLHGPKIWSGIRSVLPWTR